MSPPFGMYRWNGTSFTASVTLSRLSWGGENIGCPTSKWNTLFPWRSIAHAMSIMSRIPDLGIASATGEKCGPEDNRLHVRAPTKLNLEQQWRVQTDMNFDSIWFTNKIEVCNGGVDNAIIEHFSFFGCIKSYTFAFQGWNGTFDIKRKKVRRKNQVLEC